jgi:hypothetical protein
VDRILSSTLNNLCSLTRRPPRRSPHDPGTRLTIEQLEDRELLTTFLPGYLLARHAGRAAPLSSPGPTGYAPAQVRHAYGFDQVAFNGVAGDGSGQTIAIVDAYDDPNVAGDLVQFDRAFGLPNPVFSKVNQRGGTTPPPASSAWGPEITLDVEWAHAIAPGARILLVEADSNSNANLFAAVGYAAAQPGVSVVSMSWGTPEYAGEAASDGTFTTPAGHPGVTFLAAPGDSGAPASYPSVSPNVVSVGGTTLTLDTYGNWSGESGWSGGAGGVSAYEPQPFFQVGMVPQTSANRTAPDVAFDGDPSTGFPIYDTYNFPASAPWAQYGGTSAGAPQWSALVAIADQGRALAGLGSLDGPGQTLPALSQLPAGDFHDITTGTSAGTPHYTAGPGYDLVTGRGSPVANLVIRDLVSYTGSPATSPWANLSGTALSAVAARNADGSQQVFAVGTDNALWVRTQAATGGWGSWTSLGGVVRGLAVTMNAAGWQGVFAIGGDGAVWTRSETSPGVWTGWASLGGAVKSLTAGRDANGTEEVFAIGTDNALWTRRESAPGAWAGWASLGGTGQAPVVTGNRQGLLDMFVIGSDSGVWMRSETAPSVWTAWASLGGAVRSLAAGQDADGTEEVFAVGSDGALWTRRETAPGAWTAWASLGGSCQSVVVALNRQGLLDVFVVGSDGAAWMRSETAAAQWAYWTGLGGVVRALAAGLDCAGCPEVFALGPNATVWWKDQAPAGWWV